MATTYPPCADCGHAIGFHDPCSECARLGRTCRSYVTERTKQAKARREAPKKRRRR